MSTERDMETFAEIRQEEQNANEEEIAQEMEEEEEEEVEEEILNDEEEEEIIEEEEENAEVEKALKNIEEQKDKNPPNTIPPQLVHVGDTPTWDELWEQSSLSTHRRFFVKVLYPQEGQPSITCKGLYDMLILEKSIKSFLIIEFKHVQETFNCAGAGFVYFSSHVRGKKMQDWGLDVRPLSTKVLKNRNIEHFCFKAWNEVQVQATNIFEYGSCPFEIQCSKDPEYGYILRMMQGGAEEATCLQQYPGKINFIRKIFNSKGDNEEEHVNQVLCIYVHGEKGTGKSTVIASCMETLSRYGLKSYTMANEETKWMCGYNNQSILYFDDKNPKKDFSNSTYGTILKDVISPTETFLPVKNSAEKKMKITACIIAGNLTPEDFASRFPTDDIGPIYRRVKENVIHMLPYSNNKDVAEQFYNVAKKILKAVAVQYQKNNKSDLDYREMLKDVKRPIPLVKIEEEDTPEDKELIDQLVKKTVDDLTKKGENIFINDTPQEKALLKRLVKKKDITSGKKEKRRKRTRDIMDESDTGEEAEGDEQQKQQQQERIKKRAKRLKTMIKETKKKNKKHQKKRRC